MTGEIPTVPALVFLASLAGSLHCAGMCGPICLAACGRSRRDLVEYHVGRLLGYLVMGAVAGYAGSKVLTHYSPLISLLGAITVGGSLLFIGFRVGRGREIALPLPRFVREFRDRLLSRSVRGTGNGWAVGLLTPLLPCGWLYAFIATAALSPGPAEGAGLLFLFWLGTVPALSLVPAVAGRLLRAAPFRTRQVVAVIFVLCGVVVVSWKVWPLARKSVETGQIQWKLEEDHLPPCH